MASASRTALDLRQSQPATWFPAIKWFEQQRDWVLNPFSSDSCSSNLPLALRIFGAIDAAALHRSLEAIVQRHEVLRSRFQVVNGELQQLIAPTSDVSFREVPVSTVSTTDGEARVRDLCAREAGYPFDLTQDTLLRAKLFQLSATDHVLLLVTHRIAFDDWSAAILFRELSILYPQLASTAPASLSPLPYSYSRFAAALNQQLRGRELQSESAYWLSKFRHRTVFEYLETLELPGSSARTHGAHQDLWFNAPTRARIERVASNAQATPFMLLAGVLLRLFATQAADPDTAISCYAANRNRADLETLIGPFANRIILRADLAGVTSAPAILEKVRDAALDAYSAQKMPHGELQEAFSAAHNPRENPRTQFAMVLSDDAVGSVELPFLTISEFPLFAESTRHDISVTLNFRRRGDLVIDFLYRTALFDSETIAMLVKQYEAALHHFLDECERTAALDQTPEKSWTQTALAALGATDEPAARTADPFEQRLQKLCREIFQRESIGMETSFFDLGGDSFAAVRLLNAVEAQFGLRLSFVELWQRPTVVAFAEKLRLRTLPVQPIPEPTTSPSPSQPPASATRSRRLWGFF